MEHLIKVAMPKTILAGKKKRAAQAGVCQECGRTDTKDQTMHCNEKLNKGNTIMGIVVFTHTSDTFFFAK
ncbi:hypothetical protein OS493_006902 [Desmophyllum pertusum]|uniref:Uncharacterized protein n=1 Tax=Desmophyllum pertusum TaxID=174260 RepID=A0A9W9ZS04_9CNID|nr:hypothetical protein OS493_006902 [Desmophyllum pertusum]